MKEIRLGQKVKDKVTGFTGIAIARVEYLNGCVQICVKPKVKPKDNTYPDGQYLDIRQLKVMPGGLDIQPEDIGGDMSDIPGESYA